MGGGRNGSFDGEERTDVWLHSAWRRGSRSVRWGGSLASVASGWGSDASTRGAWGYCGASRGHRVVDRPGRRAWARLASRAQGGQEARRDSRPGRGREAVGPLREREREQGEGREMRGERERVREGKAQGGGGR